MFGSLWKNMAEFFQATDEGRQAPSLKRNSHEFSYKRNIQMLNYHYPIRSLAAILWLLIGAASVDVRVSDGPPSLQYPCDEVQTDEP